MKKFVLKNNLKEWISQGLVKDKVRTREELSKVTVYELAKFIIEEKQYKLLTEIIEYNIKENGKTSE